MKNSNRKNITAKYIAYTALFAATLTGGKLALYALPNIEIVTILVLVYASVFGVWYILPATMVFCTVEVLIHGVGIWVPAYFIYWNLLGVVASALLKSQKVWKALILAVLCTVLFGVLTTAFEVVLIAVSKHSIKVFFEMFAARYVFGIWYFVFHILSSVATVLILYRPLCSILNKIKSKTL
jgi:energy-coupling factor transport system substrate-specific component